MNRLPIDDVLPDLLAALTHYPNAVLRAPTGAGKTTRVPPALLDAGLAGTGRIVMLEPRRLAARAAARRMAAERGTSLGEEIGYHVRFDRKAGPRTRILAVTPGILLRMLHDDPFLESVGVVVFDEFHERGLDNDLALGIVRLVQQTVRPELRIVVMSATLAVESVSAYLDRCPIVVSEGRLHPVEIVWQPRSEDVRLSLAVVRAVEWLLDRTVGDVLVFLPGLSEIRQTAEEMESLSRECNLAVLPLHGDLPPEQQDSALLPMERRKVVLATNVAETSVTVEGISAVVDSGLVRQLEFDADVGLDRLRLTPISNASAEQRAGRAGRTQPGVCVRLWSEASHRARPEQTDPEVRRVDLAGAVLQLLCLGEADVRRFPWLEGPTIQQTDAAKDLLQRLGALDEHGVTPLGRTLGRLPVHPRLGRLLLAGQQLGCVERAALAAALLSERDPFTRNFDRAARRHVTESDLLDRVEALEEFERSGRSEFTVGTLHRGGARFVLQTRDQLLRALRQESAVGSRSEGDVLRALLAAYPDRVARRREKGSSRAVLVGGRGVRLAPHSGVSDAELFLCLDVDGRDVEALVRQASAIERDWLPADRLTAAIEVEFEEESERVTARKRLRFEDLLLEESHAALPSAEQVTQVLVQAAATRLERVLPTNDSAAGLYLRRVRCLRAWRPELGLPEFNEAELRELLPWVCAGRRSFDDVRRGDWLDYLQGRLTPQQLQTIDREAPERITVPSGSRLAIDYQEGRPPVLAVRIQELFGLTQTPRLAGGRVPVLLHLLAPNYRPQQVTDDLASFWKNTYPVVRKELRARYPKHAWPEDPLSADPESRPRRKRPGE